MNNLEIFKNQFRNDKDSDGFLKTFFKKSRNDIDTLKPYDLVKMIDFDCSICLCYGCRYFTHNYNKSPHIFQKKECESYIYNYFMRDFNPDTDNCQCDSCRKRRGEDTEYHYWKLSYNNKSYYICEKNLPEAKSKAINFDLFDVRYYPLIKGELIE